MIVFSIRRQIAETSRSTPHQLVPSFAVLRVATLPTNQVEDIVSGQIRVALKELRARQLEWDLSRDDTRKDAASLSNAIRKALHSDRPEKICRLRPAHLPQLHTAAEKLVVARRHFEQVCEDTIPELLIATAELAADPHTAWILDDVADRISRLRRSISRSKEKPSKRFRDAMRLLRYLSRVAHKTSPYQRYMAVGLLDAESMQAQTSILEFEFDTVETISQEWIAVLRLCYAHLLSSENRFEVASKISPNGKQAYCRVQHLDLLRGTLWQNVEHRNFRLNATLSAILVELNAAGPFDTDRWNEVCNAHGISGDQAQTLAETLLTRGMIAPVLLDQYVCETHLANPEAKDLRRLLASDRLLTKTPLMHRDAVVSFDRSPPLDHALIHDQLCATLRDLSVPAPEHRLLRDLFLEVKPRFGRSMRLSTFCTHIEGNQHQMLARLADPVLTKALRDEGLAQGSGHHPFCAQVQPFFENGNQRLVINGSFDNPAWLLARYTGRETAFDRDMRLRLRGWLSQQTALTGEHFVGLSRGSSISSLQRHQGIVDRYLDGFAPGQDRRNEHVLPQHCRVSLSENGSHLVVRDRNKQPVRFLHLGSLVPTPAWGLPFWIWHLTMPVAIERPDALAGFIGMENETQRHRPREYHGDCVLYRETWYANAHDILREVWVDQPASRIPSGTVMSRLARYFQRGGIPDQVFLSRKFDGGWQASNSLAARHRKPQWLDIANPLCVAMLYEALRDCRTVLFQEVLPGSADRLKDKNGNAHVLELHVEASLTW